MNTILSVVRDLILRNFVIRRYYKVHAYISLYRVLIQINILLVPTKKKTVDLLWIFFYHTPSWIAKQYLPVALYSYVVISLSFIISLYLSTHILERLRSQLVTFEDDCALKSPESSAPSDRRRRPSRDSRRNADPRPREVHFAVTTKEGPFEAAALARSSGVIPTNYRERGYFLESTRREAPRASRGRFKRGPVTAKLNICGSALRDSACHPGANEFAATSPTRFPRPRISRVTCVNVRGLAEAILRAAKSQHSIW